MKSKHIIILVIAFLVFVVFPFFEAFITGMIPGSGCCDYHLRINLNYDKFREKYKDMFNGQVNARRGEIILIYGSYFRVDNGKPIADTSKTFVSFGEYCYRTSDIHNNQNYCELSGVYYWHRKYLIWKIKTFFANDMVKFEHETLFE